MATGPSKTTPPSLADLFSRHLETRKSFPEEVLHLATAGSEVELYESAPLQVTDAHLAWTEATAVLRHLTPEGGRRKMPAGWGTLVGAQASSPSVPFCLGNYPQMMRDLQVLMNADRLTPPTGRAGGSTARGAGPEPRTVSDLLVAAALARVSGDLESAAAYLARAASEADGAWQAVLLNEKAALAWERGDHADAVALWDALPDSPPAWFNRGMAALFLGDVGRAREALHQAVAALPETDAWHHLARLYLTLAEARLSAWGSPGSTTGADT